ncbi:MAG: Gfo/Idh/MocA family oxidoreductase [Verrucomicrobiota bacterium]|jgi:predicted dehydrogenase|nr:Gfo/Idh/MocA family oxidoreductase [Verrucomicrobiota bacterium]
MTTSRRSFLKAAAFAGAPLILPSRVWAADTQPSDKLNIAFIGLGIQARGLLGNFLHQDVQVVAICDVDATRRDDSVKRVDAFYKDHPDKGTPGNCKGYSDFRDVLARKDINLVCVATPDHWHAYITIAAMASGKDVYCEKPLTYNIHEAAAVMAAAKKHKRILQTGAMQRSGFEFLTAAELVRNGAIGRVTRVDCNFGGPSRPHADPKEDIPLEPGLDWDLWCGGAPLVKYSDKLAPRGVHTFFPMVWRMDDLFGSGYCGDWGAHHLDIAQWGLGMDDSGPVKVIKAERSEKDKANAELGGRAQSGAVLEFANGIQLKHNPFSTFGTVFYGTEGTVSVNRGKFEFKRGDEVVSRFTKKEDEGSLDGALAKARKAFLTDGTYKTQLYKTKGGHPADFVTCAKSRQRACSNEDVGGRSAILCHLFNLSYVRDVSFDWDPVKNTFANKTGDPAWLLREGGYRKNWSV